MTTILSEENCRSHSQWSRNIEPRIGHYWGVVKSIQNMLPPSSFWLESFNVLCYKIQQKSVRRTKIINIRLFPVSGGISDELAERVISVLFEMWLTACSASFPVPSLWRTFRDMCSNWRHHEAVIIQWNRVNYALTAPLLVKLYGPDHPELVIGELLLVFEAYFKVAWWEKEEEK